MISGDQYDQLAMLALAGMSPRQCAAFFECDAEMFEAECNDEYSAIHHYFQKGRIKAEVELNMKIHESAMNGNAAMVKHYHKIMRTKEVDEIKDKHLYGED